MNKHLSLRSGNPALHKNTFKGLETTGDNTMTIDGTVNKTSIALILLLLISLTLSFKSIKVFFCSSSTYRFQPKTFV